MENILCGLYTEPLLATVAVSKGQEVTIGMPTARTTTTTAAANHLTNKPTVHKNVCESNSSNSNFSAKEQMHDEQQQNNNSHPQDYPSQQTSSQGYYAPQGYSQPRDYGLQGHSAPHGYAPQGYAPQGYPMQQGYDPQGYGGRVYNTDPPPPYDSPTMGYGTAPAHAQSKSTTVVVDIPVNEYGTGDDGSRKKKFGLMDHLRFNQFAYLEQFEDPAVRRNFIQKTYAAVTVCCVFTFGVIFTCVFVDDIREFMVEHNNYFVWPFFGAMIICDISFHLCCTYLYFQHPTDKIFLFIETILMAGWAASIACVYSKEAILYAFGATLILSAAMTILAFCTKIDFTRYQFVLFFVIIAATVISIIGCVYISRHGGFTSMKILILVISTVFVILLSLSLIINTQMLMKGKHHSLPTTAWAFGASCIYTDIILIFLYLLNIFEFSS